MKRENTNKIRFVLEELLPPIFRDSFIFKLIVKFLYRDDNILRKLRIDRLQHDAGRTIALCNHDQSVGRGRHGFSVLAHIVFRDKLN